MKQRLSRILNPVSVETPDTSHRHFRSSEAPLSEGKAHGFNGASAEHRFMNHRGSLVGVVLAIANFKQCRFVAREELGSVACEGLLSNMSFERAVGQRGPRLARQDARRAAAQLDR